MTDISGGIPNSGWSPFGGIKNAIERFQRTRSERAEKAQTAQAESSPEVKDIKALVVSYNSAKTPEARKKASEALRIYINTKFPALSHLEGPNFIRFDRRLGFIEKALLTISDKNEREWALSLLSKKEGISRPTISDSLMDGGIPPKL